ncbi:hypothetical protein [Cohnella hongkongensis]|uniref:DUF2197 domain-containing protein n=1 Tax=Cohnella hongkongensis TaxID=178337 RepID=A0ABV9F697_9BACL
MKESSVFYCVKCDQLKSIEQAGMLFRTGYYRGLYPLGCCIQCKVAARSTAAVARLDVMD